MAATVPVTAAPKAPAPGPRGVAEASGATTEAGSFADAMQAQDAPAADAESPAPAKAAADSTPAPRNRAAAEKTMDVGDDASAGTSLDPVEVDAMLGLCEGAPAAAAASSADPGSAPTSSLLDAGSCAPPAVVVALPLPVAAAQVDPSPAVPADAVGNFEAAFAPLAGLRATAGASNAAHEGALAARLEATLSDNDDTGSARDAGSPGVNATLLDPRSATTTRAPETLAAATRAPELRAPPGTPAWTDELGSRVTWMVEQGEQVASLRLSPENLGPLDVRIAVREGETTVWFGAVHPETRAALEQSLPRLREMLGASGLALANAGVFSETPRDPQRGFTAAALARAAVEGGADPAITSVNGVTHRGLVDLYA